MNSVQTPPRRRARLADLGADPLAWLAFGLGTGLVPWGAGTLGALVALPAAWGLRLAGAAAYAAVAAALAVAGIGLCGHAARRLGVHDHPGINLDEVAGQIVACAAIPLNWRWFLAAFVMFRILDIIKPPPIGWIDRRLGGGLGIMVDDIVAGGVTGAVLWGAALLMHGV